jgi:sterol desaturase/sphingolipid hydroxylase (fatty acid hydroxylase superfamily)
MDWLLLGGPDAVVFALAVAVFALLWAAPIVVATGASSVAMLTPVAAAWVALAHYEWTHLLVHTRYRPTTRRYARLARHHRLHHYRNEDHWLGVTSNIGDRLFGTLPKDRADVPLSPTARTLQPGGG